LSSFSFFAPSRSPCSRSRPEYKPTSAAVGVRFDLPENARREDGAREEQPGEEIESKGLHESGPFRFGQSVSLLDPLTFEEKIRPEFLPPVGLVESDHRSIISKGNL